MMTSSLRAQLLSAVFLGATLLASSAPAASLSLSPSSGPGYALATANCSGFTSYSNDFYNSVFWIDGSPSGQACPGSAGPDGSVANCSLPLRMPLAIGPHTVTARNPVPPGNESADATYNVIAPSVTITPTCGPPGTPVTVIGKNYPCTYGVSIWFDGGFSGMGTNADESGNFTYTFPMPIYPYGNHNIAVHGVTPSIDSITFTITTNCAGFVAFVVGSKGATVTHPNGATEPLQAAQGLQMGDTIETGAGQSVAVQGIDDTQFTLGPNAKLTVDEYVYDPDTQTGSAHYSFLRGVFVYTSGLIGHNDPDDTDVRGAYGSIGIRGTQFIVQLDPCSTTQQVNLIEGELSIVPTNSVATNIVDAPITIQFDASTVTTSALTQAAYNALSNQLFQTTGAVSFASWQIQYFGCTNGNPSADPNADPDGDGQNNLAEFLSGTDPTNNASVFRIVSAARESNNVRVVWNTHGGFTNVVQTATNAAGTFTNLSPDFIITGSNDTTTNYLDVGGFTNGPSRFYRVRLVP